MDKRYFWLLIKVVVLWINPFYQVYSQSDGFIYGKVTLKNGQSYQGQLRWEDEEAMWDDIFDAYKAERPYRHLLSADESKRLQSENESFKLGFMELWEDRNPDFSIMFRCSFGDLVRLEAERNNRVALTLKNGQRIYLEEEGGDLNDEIVVVDESIGKQSFDFSNVRSIDFQITPKNIASPFGNPIYGEILTSNGTFEGFITWDQEERLGNDIISGKQDGLLVDLRFKDIREIKADRDGSIITLHSGRELFLNDHDDVDEGNHGITVRGLPFGNLRIDWNNFISASFSEPAKPPSGYSDFGVPSLLEATIRTTSGAKLTSQIVFDLDEIYNIEFLNGTNGGFNYFIPFSLVTDIEPQNDKFSVVTVRSGEQFVLGDSGDVNIQNNGLILKFSEDRARFLEWGQVKNIKFE